MYKSLFIYYAVGVFSVLGISIGGYCFFLRHSTRSHFRLFYFAIISSIFILVAQYLKYLSLHFYVDFSHWTQLIYNVSITGKPECLNQELYMPGTLNYFSAHFVPGIYLLALPFKIWPYSETLIMLNFILMLSSIIPLYKIAGIYHKGKQFGLFVISLLLWYPPFQYITLYEFEMLRFSIPVILWMLYFWEKRKLLPYFVFVVLAVLVREEVGLTIMMLGLYLSFIKKDRFVGLMTTIIGLGGFVIITQIIMPSLNYTVGSEHIATASFDAFGGSPGEIILNIFRHPLTVLKTILHPMKAANVFMFFLPLLFVPLLMPSVLICILANFGVVLLSRTLTHSSYMLYYLSPSIPLIFYAFITAWSRLLYLLEKMTEKRFGEISKVNNHQAAMAAVFAGTMIANVFFGPSPISLQFWFKNLRPAPYRTQNFHHSVYKITEHHRGVEEFCRLIPDSSIVSTQQFLFPRLFKKKAIMIFPALEKKDGDVKAEYVFFDITNNGIKEESPAYIPEEDFVFIENDKKTWKLIASDDEYYLYKRINSEKDR